LTNHHSTTHLPRRSESETGEPCWSGRVKSGAVVPSAITTGVYREVPSGLMIEVTDWARDILTRSHHAARRFNPGATIRLARIGGQVQATLAEGPAADDHPVEIGEVTIYVESGLEGLIDVEEPHDRLVLKPSGSPPNPRGMHGE
jgi:hypothetical protein